MVCDIFDDPDDSLWAWNHLYKEVRSDYIKERVAKVRAKSLPWMNSKIRKLMNKRFKLLKVTKRSKLTVDWEAYKEKRNEVTKALHVAEKNYWNKILNEASNKDKKNFLGGN